MNYVIAGTGPAGVIAAETLRSTDPAGNIIVIGAEPGPPYSRMAIPYLLAENIGENGTHLRHGKDHYAKRRIDIRHDHLASVDPAAGTVTLAGGDRLPYDRLLVATGSHTIKPPINGVDLPGVENCWTLEDARRIMEQTNSDSHVVLMGAGFIGCIVLEALVERKVKLSVVEMADRMVPRMMDDTGGEMIKRWCLSHGIDVHTSTRVESISRDGDTLRLSLANGETLDADLVVCATGVKPNVEFLDGSGVEIDTGILVNQYLESTVPGIFAAGDVAQGPDLSTGKQEVHAIQPTASEHGRIAALNMAGVKTAYRGSLSMNVLNTVGLISSSFGLWDGVEGGETAQIIDHERFQYLRLNFRDDLLVGALALGLTQHVGVIRGLIQTEVKLGPWKDKLMANPHLVMDAYLDRTHGTAIGWQG